MKKYKVTVPIGYNGKYKIVDNEGTVVYIINDGWCDIRKLVKNFVSILNKHISVTKNEEFTKEWWGNIINTILFTPELRYDPIRNNKENYDEQSWTPYERSKHLTIEERERLFSIFENAKQGDYTIDPVGNKYIYYQKDCYSLKPQGYDTMSEEEKFNNSSITYEGINYGSMSPYYRYLRPFTPCSNNPKEEISWNL